VRGWTAALDALTAAEEGDLLDQLLAARPDRREHAGAYAVQRMSTEDQNAVADDVESAPCGGGRSPYPAAIAAGVRLVMVSWVIYPAFDAHWPAGLSLTIVQKDLRQGLRFRGVTVTDALEAGALDVFGTIQRARYLPHENSTLDRPTRPLLGGWSQSSRPVEGRGQLGRHATPMT
jgi:hypothetical protein